MTTKKYKEESKILHIMMAQYVMLILAEYQCSNFFYHSIDQKLLDLMFDLNNTKRGLNKFLNISIKYLYLFKLV